MVSIRLSLARGQVDAFQKALNEFVARLEAQSDDYVFLKTDPSGIHGLSVYEISTGKADTLDACLDHVLAAVPVNAALKR